MTAGREYPTRPIVGIGIVALRRPGHVLLVRRGRAPNAGAWSLPGGTQELGETAEDCARRELREETGLEANALHLCAAADSIHRDPDGRVRFHYTILDYCTLIGDGAVATAADDAAELTWAAFDALDTFDLWREVRRAIDAARQLLPL